MCPVNKSLRKECQRSEEDVNVMSEEEVRRLAFVSSRLLIKLEYRYLFSLAFWGSSLGGEVFTSLILFGYFLLSSSKKIHRCDCASRLLFKQ